MNIIYRIEKHSNLIMIFVLVISLIFCSLADGFAAAASVKNGCLRLHILASSESNVPIYSIIYDLEMLLEKFL